MRALGRFRADQSGAAAILFGLSIFPLMGVVGAAIDYSRAAAEHSRLQVAADATALALVREPKTASEADLTGKAIQVFRSTYRPIPGVTLNDPVVVRDGRSIRVTASGRMDTLFMGVVGFNDLLLGTEARAAWGQERLEVALVLDNTGSMREMIGSKVRIDELKRWAGKFVDDLKKEAAGPDDVRISVVPFDTEVRIRPGTYRNASWLRFDGVDRSDWTGYVVDRHQPYDVSDAKPVAGDTRYTTVEKSEWAKDGKLAYVQPLVSLHAARAYDDVKATIGSMKPRGNTNVGIGVAWGLGTLTGSIPLETTASADERPVRRYIVVLTDGDNTQNRVDGKVETVWFPGTSRIDPARVRKINERTLAACATAKDANVGKAEIFTIKLLQGDEATLRACASAPNERTGRYYFDVQSETQLESAFADILRSIGKTRLTH